jgi:hypothetical protein
MTNQNKTIDQIPDYPLGEAPESLDGIQYRLVLIKRALAAGYEDIENPQDVIKDALSDLRHLCDFLDLPFSKLDRMAQDNYKNEVRFAPRSSAVVRTSEETP